MMKPGTKPKPTSLKLIEGNRGKRALNRREPKIAPALPSAPPHLNADALEEWNRVAVWLHRIGLLSEVDRAGLAAYAQAYGRWVYPRTEVLNQALPVFEFPKTEAVRLWVLPFCLRERKLVLPACGSLDEYFVAGSSTRSEISPSAPATQADEPQRASVF